MKTILVVDDEYITHRIVTVILGSKNYKILSAYNGLEALEQLYQTPVDIIVTDVNMPYLDGIALLRRVRADKRYCHLPIVMISASTQPQIHKEGLEKGATAFLHQPISYWELNQVISSCLEKAGAGPLPLSSQASR